MSGDKNKPNLYQEERQEAQTQNGALDAFMRMTKVISPFGPTRGIHFGRTNFEGYDLNDMIDIVESAKPELLESAGTAMIAARDAIKKAAEELKDNLPGVDWEGEAHTAFDSWAKSLVKTAEGVGEYADIVGTQVLAAGSGLASVRKSMPPRDTRSLRKTVEDIPEAKRTESNDEYTAAVKAEKNRQEAINQMYRLASFYTVSAGAMRAAEEPVFPKMPDVGVPKPSGNYVATPPSETGEISLAPSSNASSASRGPTSVVWGQTRSESQSFLGEGQQPDTPPTRPVGTQIDSVGTLPPQETARPVNGAPPPTTGPSTSTGTLPPMVPGTVPPAARGLTGRTAGPHGVPGNKSPAPAQGRAAGPAGQSPAGRTATGPVAQSSRAATSGPVGSRGIGPLGPVGRAATPGQAGSRGAGPAGRGIVGGVPRPEGRAAGPSGGVARSPLGSTGTTSQARSNSGRAAGGVVGGRPVTGATPRSQGSKLAPGTVIGGGDTPAAQTGRNGRADQRAVIGGPAGTAPSGQSSHRVVPSPGGVIGSSQGRTPGENGSGSAAGVVSRPGGKQGTGEQRTRRVERRDGASASD
jgi:uncharacterized protein YukE